MSEKRKQTGTTSPLEAQHKRAKGAINSVVKEYVCPIALELPVDPVTAEDGRVYNRADIQKHIDNSKRVTGNGSTRRVEYRGLKSPMTKEPMGPNLFPAIQVRNSIRALIDSGAIDGDEGSAKRWKKVDDLKTKAESGDLEAMMHMGELFYNGEDGIVKDDAKAYWWFSRGADLDRTPAIGAKGASLLDGIGTRQNRVEGGILTGIAADRGHGPSQFILGYAFFEGCDGITKNLTMAKYWLQKAIAQEGKWSLSEDYLKEAKEMIESIKKEEAGRNLKV